MNITKVTYRKFVLGEVRLEEWSGEYRAVDGGIVLIFSEKSQMFLPHSQIERIEQTIVFGEDVPSVGVRYEQSLVHIHRRK